MTSGHKQAPKASNATTAVEAKKRKRVAKEEAAQAPAAKTLPVGVAPGTEEGVPLANMPLRPSWKPIPTADICSQHGWAQWTPAPLKHDFKQAVVALPGGNMDDTMWPAAAAVLDVHKTAQQGVEKGSSQTNVVVVVCGSIVSAAAVAWSARCRGVTTAFSFSTADEDMKRSPAEHIGSSSLILVSEALFAKSESRKLSTNVSEWMDGRTVVVLPDVANPTDYQTMTSRAVFIKFGGEASSPAGKANKKKKSETDDELAATHKISAFGQGSSLTPIVVEDIKSVAAPRSDNILQAAFARGDLFSAIDRIIEVYRNSRARCEDVLLNALVSDWGSTSEIVAHHKLAYILRVLVDKSKLQERESLELHTIALRAICKCVRMLPPLNSTNCKKVGDNLPNLSLHATMTYVFKKTSLHVIDALGTAWGVTAVIPGMQALDGFDKKRAEQVHRVRTRFAARVGDDYAEFLVVLMHLATNATAIWSMQEDEVAYITQWNTVLAQDCGPLSTFLIDAMLSPEAKKGGVSSGATGGSQLIRPQKGLGSKTAGETKGVKVNSQITSLPTQKLPLVGTRTRQKESLNRMAVEEVLSAMPRKCVPMYMGDVGQLIGIWSKFNAKYDGALPTTLSEFLFQNPDDFAVIQNVVTRKKEGIVDQIRIRYDREDNSNEDDDDDMKQGPGKKIHRKKKRRQKLQEINRGRFDKNRKKFDESAKVPGYTKLRPKAVKGRGNKKNIRRYKRFTD